jgi:hypothetical protein
VLVLEIEVIALLPFHLVDLTEPVHVQLSNERLYFIVTEKQRKDRLLQSLLILNKNLTVVLTPTYNVLKFIFLHKV